jgi:hypothetical protein
MIKQSALALANEVGHNKRLASRSMCPDTALLETFV